MGIGNPLSQQSRPSKVGLVSALTDHISPLATRRHVPNNRPRLMAVRYVDTQDSSQDLAQVAGEAAEALSRGELIVVPTETVYGVAAKPNVPAAAARLSELRRRATSPLTPHVPDAQGAATFLGEVSQLGQRLMAKLWPGPVALTFDVDEPRRREVAGSLGVPEKLIFSDRGQVVLRCPDQPLTAAILRQGDQPVVVSRAGLPDSSHANRAPTSDSVPPQISLILDSGPTRFTRPSTIVHVEGGQWEIVREGVFDRRIIERMLHTTLLFVCSGNTCRSPMAAALARKVIAEHAGVSQADLGEQSYEVVSAGTFAMPGMKATPQAAEAVAGLGGDLSGHRSQPLTVELINRADWIVTMSRSHAETVVSLVPSAIARTVALDPQGDIEDPIGSDVAHYRQLAEQMDHLIRRWLGETLLRD